MDWTGVVALLFLFALSLPPALLMVWIESRAEERAARQFEAFGECMFELGKAKAESDAAEAEDVDEGGREG